MICRLWARHAIRATHSDCCGEGWIKMNDISLENKWIGQSTPRPDGIEKVTGSAQYAADFNMPGMVWGKVLRSPHAHALIKKNRYLEGGKIERRVGGYDRR
jgi:hypothetical protein